MRKSHTWKNSTTVDKFVSSYEAESGEGFKRVHTNAWRRDVKLKKVEISPFTIGTIKFNRSHRRSVWGVHTFDLYDMKGVRHKVGILIRSHINVQQHTTQTQNDHKTFLHIDTSMNFTFLFLFRCFMSRAPSQVGGSFHIMSIIYLSRLAAE